jgi:hypothetical protein
MLSGMEQVQIHISDTQRATADRFLALENRFAALEADVQALKAARGNDEPSPRTNELAKQVAALEEGDMRKRHVFLGYLPLLPHPDTGRARSDGYQQPVFDGPPELSKIIVKSAERSQSPFAGGSFRDELDKTRLHAAAKTSSVGMVGGFFVPTRNRPMREEERTGTGTGGWEYDFYLFAEGWNNKPEMQKWHCAAPLLPGVAAVLSLRVGSEEHAIIYVDEPASTEHWVIGSGPYMTGSHVATAYQHTTGITTGGWVKITIAAQGCATWQSTTQHGVTSRSFPPAPAAASHWDSSSMPPMVGFNLATPTSAEIDAAMHRLCE